MHVQTTIFQYHSLFNDQISHAGNQFLKLEPQFNSPLKNKY